jgi:hypothetical protein
MVTDAHAASTLLAVQIGRFQTDAGDARARRGAPYEGAARGASRADP